MEKVTLCPMTRELCHALYRNWQNDPAVYADPAVCAPYHYDAAQVDQYYDAKQEPDRIFLAILLEDRVIGEIHLKRIDREKGECALGIHLQSDAVKEKGYGTRAEKLALRYAFDTLGLRAVEADALIGNTRSQHVLEKAGFTRVGEDERFRDYRCEEQK